MNVYNCMHRSIHFDILIATIILCIVYEYVHDHITNKSLRLLYINGIPESTKCQQCTADNIRFIKDGEEICVHTGPIDILILIFTKLDNFVAREAIRDTWIHESLGNTKRVRYGFMLGIGTNQTMQTEIEEEIELHKDIIQSNFIDAYRNLSLKTMMSLKWVSTKCPRAQWLVKADDDMFVNTIALSNIIESRKNDLLRSIGGYCMSYQEPVRDVTSQYHVSEVAYPYTRYPPFCSGTTYVMHSNLAREIYEKFGGTVPFVMEDVFMGYCLQKLGYSVIFLPGFKKNYEQINDCFYKGHSVAAAHHVTPSAMKRIWKEKCVHTHFGRMIELMSLISMA